MGQALKNMRARNKTKSKDTTESGEAIAEEHDVIQSLSQLQLDDDSLKNDFQMLKLALVNKENIADIKNKMKSTMKYRKNLMNIPETDVLECFPYLFTHPELVSIEISLVLKMKLIFQTLNFFRFSLIFLNILQMWILMASLTIG